MTVYTSATMGPFLEQVRASNLTASAKTQAGQLAADAIALSAKVQALEAELAKLQLQRVNETVNQPSGKKPEWDKGNGADPDKPPPKRKLGGRRPGSGNRPKPNPKPDRSIHNPLERCPECQTDLSSVPPAGDVNERIIEDMEPPAEKTVVTEETSDRKWCPSCQKIISAKSALALPRSDIGLHASVRIVYLWVVAALSLPNIQNYLSGFMRLRISTSGISNLLIRVATILEPVAEEILRDVAKVSKFGPMRPAGAFAESIGGFGRSLMKHRPTITPRPIVDRPSSFRFLERLSRACSSLMLGALITPWTVCSARPVWPTCFVRSAA